MDAAKRADCPRDTPAEPRESKSVKEEAQGRLGLTPRLEAAKRASFDCCTVGSRRRPVCGLLALARLWGTSRRVGRRRWRCSFSSLWASSSSAQVSRRNDEGDFELDLGDCVAAHVGANRPCQSSGPGPGERRPPTSRSSPRQALRSRSKQADPRRASNSNAAVAPG